MKKIMFNDRYGLTEAVLSGRKTQTRRFVSESLWNKWTEYDDFCGSVGVRGLNEIGVAVTREYSDCEKFFLDNSPFKVGEVVAVAQSYASIVDELEDPKNFCCMEHWESAGPKRAHYAGFLYHPGMTNKMFVSAKEMPHHIRITDVRVERLQDISDEDCIAEGIEMWRDLNDKEHYCFFDKRCKGLFPYSYSTPHEAYAALINRISGKGVWESNPYVFVYEFELLK